MEEKRTKTNTEADASQGKISIFVSFFGVANQEKIFFVQQLGLMLKSGVSLSKALLTLSKQAKSKYMKVVLERLYHSVDHGKSLADSMRDYPKIFDELFVNMLAAGEKSGKYEEVLDQLYLQMKKSHELKGKVRGAMIYPSVIVVAMIGIGTAMMIFVIPKLTSIFDEVNVALPLPTRILIGLSGFITSNLILISIAVVILITIFSLGLRNESFKYYFHVVLLRTPIMGPIIKKVNIVRFSRTLGSLLKTDIPIIEALRLTSRVLGSRPYRKEIAGASEFVKKGKTIHSALAERSDLFSPVITQMISVGEETGSLDTILSELSTFFDEEVSQTLDNLPALIEPVLLLVLGAGVGGMAVAIIMPLYSITQAI